MNEAGFQVFVLYLIVLFFSIGIHEYAHCKMADLAGDPTPRMMGRVTLDLTKHHDPLGAMLIVISSFVGFGIGWGKPAPFDPRNLKNPRLDTFMIVAAGPLSNLVLAIVFGLLGRLIIAADLSKSMPEFGSTLLIFSIIGVTANIGLMLFNLIPLGPLDGHWLIGECLPDKARIAWYRFHRSVGFFAVLALILLSNILSSATGYDPMSTLLRTPGEILVNIIIGR